MAKSRVFLILSLSFIFGIFAVSFFGANLFIVYFFLVASIIIISLGCRNKIALVAGAALLFLALGIWRTGASLDKLKNSDLDGKDFSGNVIVAKEPEKKDNYQNVAAKTREGIKILLRTGVNADINYGEELEISCILKIPENKGGFDYRMYLAKDKIYYLCQNAKFSKTGKNFGNKFYSAILKLKNKMENNVNRAVPYPESALANGLIFGGSGDLPKQLKENFSRTGMTHIVAVSGYNVTIIAEYLIWFFIFIGFWRKQAFWFAIFGIILFIAMIGFPSSAVRAGVMGVLLLWAMKNGRLASSWNAIIFAGAAMLLINPLLLRWDIGFQLSFLATIGIISFSPFWEKYFVRKNRALGLTEIFFLTLSAQIFVLPVIIYNFHTLSLVSLLANILILLIIPISMLLIFLTAAAGLIFAPLSLPFAWIAYLPLKYEVWVINTLAGLDWSSKNIENFGWLYVIVWYLVLAGIILFSKRVQKTRSEISGRDD